METCEPDCERGLRWGSWWKRRGGPSKQREQHVQKYRAVLLQFDWRVGAEEVRPGRQAGSQSWSPLNVLLKISN